MCSFQTYKWGLLLEPITKYHPRRTSFLTRRGRSPQTARDSHHPCGPRCRTTKGTHPVGGAYRSHFTEGARSRRGKGWSDLAKDPESSQPRGATSHPPPAGPVSRLARCLRPNTSEAAKTAASSPWMPMSPEALAEHAPNPSQPRAATPTVHYPRGPTLPYPQSAGRAPRPDGRPGRVRVNAPRSVSQEAEAVNTLGREGWEAIKPGMDYSATQRRKRRVGNAWILEAVERGVWDPPPALSAGVLGPRRTLAPAAPVLLFVPRWLFLLPPPLPEPWMGSSAILLLRNNTIKINRKSSCEPETALEK